MAKSNQKKGTGKGKSQKKGASPKRPAVFRLAVGLLLSVALVLLVLALVHQARTRHWFAPAVERSVPPTKDGATLPAPSQKPAPSTAKAPHSRRSDFRPPAPPALPVPSISRSEGPMVAIIVDDLGANLGFMRALLALDLNVTAAILPNLPHAREAAQLAQAANREVILHIPMEPKAYPADDPGAEPLLIELSAGEVRHRLEQYFKVVPFAVGANNHMGSRFTEDQAGMAVVLETLKTRGMYFVDSRTSNETVAYRAAQRLGVKTAARDLFLDNVQTVAAISAELRRLAEMAKIHGRALGICHPHPETLAALKQEAPYLAKLGVRLVPASVLTE